MQVQTSEHGAASVVRLIGRMDERGDCEPLQRTVRELADSGKRSLVLNMENVEFLGPPGMGALIGALDTMTRCGGQLKLACVQGHPGNMLATTRMDRLFDICTDEQEALMQFAPAGAAATGPAELSQWTSKTVIEFPSTEGNITEAARRFGSFLEQLRIDVGTKFNLQVAFHEAFANAVKHGNKADPSKCVVAECTANDRMLKICVTDEGEGFDTKTAIALKSNPFHDGGNGLDLIRNLMDEVSYNSKGNSISMVKFCSQALPEQHSGKDYSQVL